MNHTEEMRVDGKTMHVPALPFKNRRVVAKGKWVKLAVVKDEQLCEGELVDDPDGLVAELKRARFKADILNFAQGLSETSPKHKYHMEWDNAAVIDTRSYDQWWNKLSQDTRRNVRRATKMGVTARIVPFNDDLVHGILDIYNETPIRQGKPFWHYGKSFDVVKNECATYPDRSVFLGAYLQNSLVGFCKLTYADDCAHIIHILSREEHSDKRPTNALIAKAVEVCAGKGLTWLTYCRYIDGGNEQSPLTEFKRRNGFEPLRYPRYYVPLNLKGKLALQLGVHHGLRNRLPKSWIPFLLKLRTQIISALYRKQRFRAETTSVPTPANACEQGSCR
jgi:hypothetical protein